MAELSSAARVMVAVTHSYQDHAGEPPARAVAAAALRAAALILQQAYADETCPDHPDDFLLDIATELESVND